MPDRAQSEVVGATLLLGIVVIVVGVAGAYGLSAATSWTDTPRADVDDEVRTDGIALTHQGGDALASDDLRLIVRVDGSETSLSWADGTLTGGDTWFDPGDEWRVSREYAPDSVVAITLVHEPSNRVVVDVETNPTAPTGVVGDGGKVDARDTEGEIPGGTGDGGETSLRVRIDDLTDRDTDNPYYVVSYDAPVANDSFDHVEVEFDSGWDAETGTRTDETERGSVSFRGGYGQNEEYTITVRTYYTTDTGGTVVGRTRTITDRADAANPTNDDLSESGSPSLDPSTTITDRSDPERTDVRYRFDYEVDTNGNYQQVLLGVVNRNNDGGTAVEFHEQANRGRTVGVEYGTETEYKVTILVFDADGAVADTKTRFDEADGGDEGPPGRGG